MMVRVAVAISAFRSDSDVIALLEAVFADPHPDVIHVIVVDSLGTGRIVETAHSLGWQIEYENSSKNLGSAGNLARRLQLAQAVRADWCLCLNHDASWSSSRLSALLSTAVSSPRVGAVYPVLDHSPRLPRWELGRQKFNPFVGTKYYEIPKDKESIEVYWGSSNGALYSLAPQLENINIMSELWMGYEDLAYGIALKNGCWLQRCCLGAQLENVFDYASRDIFGVTVHTPDKPSWYSYYNIRNLILIRRAYGNKGVSVSSIIFKLCQSTIRVVLLEKNKNFKIRLLYFGVFAGLMNRSGKGPYP